MPTELRRARRTASAVLLTTIGFSMVGWFAVLAWTGLQLARLAKTAFMAALSWIY